MNTDINAQDIINAINAGDLDEGDLGGIANAVALRQHLIRGRRQASNVSPGDTVTITGSIRPKYMRGEEVGVVRVNRTRAVVRTLRDIGKFREGQEITVPLGCVE